MYSKLFYTFYTWMCVFVHLCVLLWLVSSSFGLSHSNEPQNWHMDCLGSEAFTSHMKLKVMLCLCVFTCLRASYLVWPPQLSELPPPCLSWPLRGQPVWPRAPPSGRSTLSCCSTGGPAWGWSPHGNGWTPEEQERTRQHKSIHIKSIQLC